MNEKMARNRAKRTAAGLTFGEIPNYDGEERTITGTSIFDPVLCELVYRWFSPPGGLVVDPFAGGSVRGIVASRLGRRYVGVDLRAEQVEANRRQGKIADPKFEPIWMVGDAINLASLWRDGMYGKADLIFSCPPYGDLEVYSDDPRDLSTMPVAEFREAYRSIVAGACALLADHRFACFVVGDYRDKSGGYQNLPGVTVEAFEAAGLRLYNEAILVTAVGSLPIRAKKQFEASRKLGKTHQNVLVFCKGDPAKAAKAIGQVDFGAGDDAILPNGADPAAAFGEIM